MKMREEEEEEEGRLTKLSKWQASKRRNRRGGEGNYVEKLLQQISCREILLRWRPRSCVSPRYEFPFLPLHPFFFFFLTRAEKSRSVCREKFHESNFSRFSRSRRAVQRIPFSFLPRYSTKRWNYFSRNLALRRKRKFNDAENE